MAEISRKTYIIIAVLILFLAGMWMIFSNWGCSVFQGWIDSAYESCQPQERKTQRAADWQLTLAWWYEVSLRDEEAIKCYEDFLEKKKDWGWIHPRAPEAAINRLLVWERHHSSEANRNECIRTLEMIHSHPRYKEFYPDFEKFMIRNRGQMPEWARAR